MTALDDTKVYSTATTAEGEKGVEKTVKAVLQELRDQCETGGRMHEAETMLQLLVARFQAVHERFNAWYRNPPGTKNLRYQHEYFVEPLKHLYAKLCTHATLSLANRVVDCELLLKLLDSVLNGRDGLATAVTALDDSGHGPMETWTQQAAYDAARASYKGRLRDAMAAFHQRVEANLVANKLKVVEAAVVFKAAKESGEPLKFNDIVKEWTPKIDKLVKEANVPAFNLDLPPWFIPLERIQYESTTLARGSFGSVHWGKWGSGTNVVVKKLFLHRANGANPQDDEHFNLKLQEVFIKEAKLWAQLKHPYVCSLWGACHVSKPPLMVCEAAVKYGDLVFHLTRDVGKKRFWRLMYHMALGVEYLHDKNIVHGDLKLNNVVVADDGYPRVTDFGLSRFKRSSDAYSTVADEGVQTAGALRWRAPECIGEGSVNPQKPSDVYSLGMCLYEAFSGKPPYMDDSDAVAAKKIKAGELPTRPADVPNGAWDLITRMTNLNPEERPSIATVAVELYKFVTEEEKKEWDGIFVCVKCGSVITRENRHCVKCNKVVQIRPKDGSEPFVIKNKDDLPRVVEMLASKSNPQRLSATSALKTYIFGDPTHQKETSDAKAMAVLAKLVNTREEAVDVQLESQVTLGCVAVGNKIGQKDANFEAVIPRLKDVLKEGGSKLKTKSAMVLGYLSYGNPTNHDEIVKDGSVIKDIKALLSETEREGSSQQKEEHMRSAKKALAILRSPQTEPVRAQPAAFGA